MSVGCHQSGLDLRLSVELDPAACKTLRKSHSFHNSEVIEADVSLLPGQEIRKLAGLGKTDPLLVVGGPPCQPFSKNAYWTDPGEDAEYRRARSRGEKSTKPNPIVTPKVDSRRDLLGEFLRIVVESKAEAFIFENVPSILHPRNKKTFHRFCDHAEFLGFQLRYQVLNATDFGVPQNRYRLVLVGAKRFVPKLPTPSHSAKEANDLHLLPTPTVKEAIRGFGGARYIEQGESISGRWEHQLREIPPGKNYKALTAWAGHPSPSFEAETRFWNFLLKLHPNRPSWTIAASPGPWTGPFHWDNRRLRVPELAAIQGFPRGYKFEGARREKVKQIGNAMPAPLAKAVVEAVLSS